MFAVLCLTLAASFLSACDGGTPPENQSYTTTPAPTKVVPTIVISPTITVESDADLQKIFDSDSDTGFDAEFKKLQEDLK